MTSWHWVPEDKTTAAHRSITDVKEGEEGEEGEKRGEIKEEEEEEEEERHEKKGKVYSKRHHKITAVASHNKDAIESNGHTYSRDFIIQFVIIVISKDFKNQFSGLSLANFLGIFDIQIHCIS